MKNQIFQVSKLTAATLSIVKEYITSLEKQKLDHGGNNNEEDCNGNVNNKNSIWRIFDWTLFAKY